MVWLWSWFENMIFEYTHFKGIFLLGEESELHQAIQEAEKDLIKVLDINTFHTSLLTFLPWRWICGFLTTALHIRINMFTYANINFKSKLVYFTYWTFEYMRYKIDTFWWSMKWGKSRWHIVTWVVSVLPEERGEREDTDVECQSYCSAVSLQEGVFKWR